MWSEALQAFVVVFVAELGDKSQLVCLTLAARYGARPVVLGAVLAFALLNALGVLAGAVVAAAVPRSLLLAAVAAGFWSFGLHALLGGDASDEVGDVGAGPRPVLVAFAMTFASELGDKTQLAVAGMAMMMNPLAAWVGATAALASTSMSGAVLGRSLLARLPAGRMRTISGLLFLAFGATTALAAWQAWQGT
jgi:putative Ca2+/H+ antiporter (TMEM165/GDT1 family)